MTYWVLIRLGVYNRQLTKSRHAFFWALHSSRSFFSFTLMFVHIFFVTQYFFLLLCFSALATPWSTFYLIAAALILFDMAGLTELYKSSNLANGCTVRELHVDGWRKNHYQTFPKISKILMIYLQKMFYRFEINILKYYDSENLNHFQAVELLFRQRLTHGQSSLNFMFVSNSLVFM